MGKILKFFAAFSQEGLELKLHQDLHMLREDKKDSQKKTKKNKRETENFEVILQKVELGWRGGKGQA